ncbi:MAG: ParB/RepB/Spo0J family partition protein [Elusimicrobia bacterium]|nr:ParB/RepB/Spo0J family partition protein [Elusimicrobiota bacterium]
MRKALGKGLAALIPAADSRPPETATKSKSANPVKVPIGKIRANRFQPRKHFDQEKLAELAASIREHGLAQPIIVSSDGDSGAYELIAGERRLRACELAGLNEVEVVVRHADNDRQRLALSLIENIQREDLNAIEEALGYLRLIKEFHISQTELTQVIGKSKSAISNTLRLLSLPENMQKAIQFGQITEGHARAILMIDSAAKQQELFDKVLSEKLSVRDTEDIARSLLSPSRVSKKISKTKPPKPADVTAIENKLQHAIGTKVDIKTKNDPTKGSITIHFYSVSDFDRIVNLLGN